jgi:hypothetical protein
MICFEDWCMLVKAAEKQRPIFTHAKWVFARSCASEEAVAIALMISDTRFPTRNF